MIEVKTMWCETECFVTVDKYKADGSTAVQLWDADGPFATMTVCLDDKSLGPNEAYLDTNNFPEGPGLVEKYGLGEMTGKWKASGFCMYPAVKFDPDALAKHFCPET